VNAALARYSDQRIRASSINVLDNHFSKKRINVSELNGTATP